MKDDIATTVMRDTTSIFGPALVLSVDEGGRTAQLYYACDSGVERLDAVIALQYPGHLHAGDRVLVSGEAPENLFIIGLLNSAQQERRLVAPDGASVRLVTKDEVCVIQVLSPDNRLMVEYDCKSGKTCIAGEGDIEINAPAGRIELAAEREIALQSSQVSIRGQTSVALSAGPEQDDIAGQVSINERQVWLRGRDINLSGQRGSFHFGEYRMVAREFIGKALRVRFFAEKVETTSVSVISRVKDWYQTATNLVQIKSGRLRLLSDTTFFQKSRSTVLKAEEDVKVKAEKIHLG
ncbi:DUF3540 domain-containing protein [Desulfopila sp. IMCC35008]|uniref:DUF3540 domain-containing protein n=1 Tax=Desulfopila sp. IMCC35008 TaxID=2653858 RepID=UPI0013D70DE1|nr:DUF3540 domain-containing protein [Desulfopila sp. IMCC35008]